MKNELQRHKNSDKVKWTLTAIAFVLVAILLTSICLQVFGNGKVKPSKWFEKDKPQSDRQEENGGAVLTEGVSKGLKMAQAKIEPQAYAANGVSEQAESAYELTVTFVPSNADPRPIDWTVRWVDPEYTWAVDKNPADYVSVTPETDGAATATVACLQPFGEQIEVVAALRENSEISVSCKVDYLKRILSFNPKVKSYKLWTISEYVGESSLKSRPYVVGKDKGLITPLRTVYTGTYPTVYADGVYNDRENNFLVEPIFSVGTCVSAYFESQNKQHNDSNAYKPKITSVKFAQTQEYVDALVQTGCYKAEPPALAVLEQYSIAYDDRYSGDIRPGIDFALSLEHGINNTSSQTRTITERRNAAVQALRALGDKPFFILTVSTTYEDALAQSANIDTSYTYEIPIYADIDSLQTVVDSLTGSQSSVVF